MKIKFFYSILSLSLFLFFSCATAENYTDSDDEISYILKPGPSLESAPEGSALVSPETPDSELMKIRGYKEVKAIEKSYPGVVTDLSAEGDDITFLLNGKQFYYASGSLLPEDKIDMAGKYRSYGFYHYPEKLPPIIPPDSEKLKMIESFVSKRGTTPRDNSFLEEIYSAHTFDEILEEIKYINFLGFKFEVHKNLIPRFKAVEKEILFEAARDTELKDFVASLNTAGSFNWRRANGSRSRSYHSYGIAVDFNPVSFGRKQVFWDWSRKFDDKWYNIPYSKRWMVHEKFVSAFEKQGFVWGGKWLYFDNMHFEYRPEILILSGRNVENLSN